MKTFLFNFSGSHDDAEEFEAEVEADELVLSVRVIDGDDEPIVFDYKVTDLGIEPIDI
ncbi:MAG: hypothetical protein ABR507_08825 [Actinomycetota bacterium]|nr:hypothetical protein [Actinomycetota bacterium]